MKHLVRYLQIIPATLLVVACANEKDPVANIEDLRAKAAQSELDAKKPKVPEKPITEYLVEKKTEYKPVEVKVPVDKEVPVNILVQRVGKESLVIDAVPVVTFTEGKSSSFTMKVRCTIPECTPALTAESLPEGAVFQKANSNELQTAAYTMTWKPRIGLTPADSRQLEGVATLKASATVKNPKHNEALKNFNFSQTVTYFVSGAPILVKDVAITGLPAEVQENTQATFTVTARVTGVDPDSAEKPTLQSKNDVSITVPNGPPEIGGANYVTDHQEPVHKGNSVWEFKVTFDTKNFVVPRFGEGDVARAGFGVRVCMKSACSDFKTAKINVKFTKPTVATVGKK